MKGQTWEGPDANIAPFQSIARNLGDHQKFEFQLSVTSGAQTLLQLDSSFLIYVCNCLPITLNHGADLTTQCLVSNSRQSTLVLVPFWCPSVP